LRKKKDSEKKGKGFNIYRGGGGGLRRSLGNTTMEKNPEKKSKPREKPHLAQEFASESAGEIVLKLRFLIKEGRLIFHNTRKE